MSGKRNGTADLDAASKAVARDPESAWAWYGLAGVLGRLRRLDEAIAACDRVLAIDPGFAPAMLRRGAMVGLAGRHREAVGYLDGLLLLGRPDSFQATAHMLRGDSLRHLGEPAEAVAAYDRAVGLRPGVADAWVSRGKALRELGAFDDALDSYGTALTIDPGHLRARNERSILLAVLCREEEAEAEARWVIAVDPHYAAALNSLGVVLQRQGRIAEAIESFRESMRWSDDPASARFNIALCLLITGDYTRGLPAYESRRQTPEFAAPPQVAGWAQWTGDVSVAGKTVLLYPEQGLGDTIQLCRYAPLVADRGARVVLGAPAALQLLLCSVDPRVEVVGRDSLQPAFDLYCPLMSLPLAFGTEVATIPARVPYLSAPDRHRQVWRARLGPRLGPRVGIAWSGNDKPLGRSIPLDLLGPVLAMLPEVYCLQKDLRPNDVPGLAMQPHIRVFGQELRDFSDTAALVEAMDLVISIDTSVLHLAGALGRPAWGMLAFAADWRWLRERADTPWYPTMRLFRQMRSGDWGAVVEQIGAALAGWLRLFADEGRYTSQPN